MTTPTITPATPRSSINDTTPSAATATQEMDIDDAGTPRLNMTATPVTTATTTPVSTDDGSVGMVDEMTPPSKLDSGPWDGMTDQSNELVPHSDIQPHSSSIMNQTEVGREEEEEKTTMTVSPTPVNPHGIIHRLDQTTLRLCAQLLDDDEIIWFGRTCRTMYATLNHPLTWTHILPTLIDFSRDISSTNLTPFFQHFPCIWNIRSISTDVTPEKIDNALSRLPLQSYHLVGRHMEATRNDALNAASGRLVKSLLNDVRFTCHSRIEIKGSFAARPTYSMQNELLLSILQVELPQLRSRWIEVERMTNPIADQLGRSSLTILEIHSLCPSESLFLPILTAGLSKNLIKLGLPRMNYDRGGDLDCLVRLTKLQT